MKNIFLLLTIFLFFSCSGGGDSGSMEVSQNSPPVITNNIFTYDVLENQNLAFVLEALDPDGDSVNFEIVGGPDQDSFSVNNSGKVLFLSMPDFENPSDVNFDNSYGISIRAFDGSLYSSISNFTINVINDLSDDDNNNSSAICTEESVLTSYCTLDWDGLEREFYIVFPESFTTEEIYPLIISLHGGADYADANMEYTGFTEINNQNNLVLIFPQGTIAEGKGDTGWYTGGDCSSIEVCDLSFLERLIDLSIEELAVDSSRVYISGFSNGAFMAYTTACFLSNKVAAIAPVSGSLSPEDYEECNPQRPVPIIHIHGNNDSQIPLNGNDYITPVESVFSYWSTFNQCDSSYVIDGEDYNGDGFAWYSEISSDCQQGVSINYTYLEDFGHEWPSDNTNKGIAADINGASFIWDFLLKYDINGLKN